VTETTTHVLVVGLISPVEIKDKGWEEEEEEEEEEEGEEGEEWEVRAITSIE